MNEKETIVQYIGRAKSLVYDSNTFLKVRTERLFYLGEQFGGGNLLIALGLFSALSYLAKIYVLLEGHELPALKDIETAKNNFKALDKKITDYYRPVRPDEINETLAFTKLLSDQNCPQNLGIDKNEYAKIYNDIRNHLSHRVAPNRGYTVMTFQTDENYEVPYTDFKRHLNESNKSVFEVDGDSLNCYVDILVRDVEKISEWLIGKVQSDEFSEKNIKNTLNWLTLSI